MGIADEKCTCLVPGCKTPNLDHMSPLTRLLHAVENHPEELLESVSKTGLLETVNRTFSWLGERAAEKTLEILK